MLPKPTPPKQSGKVKQPRSSRLAISFSPYHPKNLSALKMHPESHAGKPKPIVVRDLRKGTPYTENATIFPCTDTLFSRVTPNPNNGLYFLDFIRMDDHTRVDKPGLSVYESLGESRRKMEPIGNDRGNEAIYDVYYLHPRVRYLICSLSGDRVIRSVFFKYQAVSEPVDPAV